MTDCERPAGSPVYGRTTGGAGAPATAPTGQPRPSPRPLPRPSDNNGDQAGDERDIKIKIKEKWKTKAALPAWAIPVTAQVQLTIFVRAIEEFHPIAYEVVQMSPDGELIYTRGLITDTGTLLAERVTLTLTSGWLISVSVGLASGVFAGFVHRVRAVLVLPGVTTRPATVLLDGMLSYEQSISWPYSVSQMTPEGDLFFSPAITAPAAGVEAAYTIPLGATARIVGARATLVTSAAVATRRAFLALDNGSGGLQYLSRLAVNQLASTTVIYDWAPDNSDAQVIGTRTLLPLTPESGRATDGYIITTATDLLQAGDQWSSIELHLQMSITPRWAF